jgi:hypothetical protein
MADYNPMDDFDYERESKKQKARELLEGLQYVQQDDAKRMDQIILSDEMVKIREQYGLTPEQEMKIQQDLAQNPALNEKAYRKSIRKRVDTILKGLAPKGSMPENGPRGPRYRSPESKPFPKEKPSDQVVEAARRRVAEKPNQGFRADEQIEIIDALLGDFLKK